MMNALQTSIPATDALLIARDILEQISDDDFYLISEDESNEIVGLRENLFRQIHAINCAFRAVRKHFLRFEEFAERVEDNQLKCKTTVHEIAIAALRDIHKNEQLRRRGSPTKVLRH
jgi:hypothetical protein